MKSIRIVQIGLGPLGRKTYQFIKERTGVRTVAAVDKDEALAGVDLGELVNGTPSGILIRSTLAEALADAEADVAVLTTVSDMARITPQILEILEAGLPVVSTCEELSFPWENAPDLARQLDERARASGVAILGTGVNPGFLMDTLPVVLSGVCERVDYVEVRRFQDARFRRLPFQKKIGAGLSLKEFECRRQEGTLRHVGLTESMQFIAHRLGWRLDQTEDVIEPVVAEENMSTPDLDIKKGHAKGVRQTGNAYIDGRVKIKLVFQATIGESESYDEIVIKGKPDVHSKILGGVNGDVATCAITINTIPQVLRSSPGLKTMGDIPPASFFS